MHQSFRKSLTTFAAAVTVLFAGLALAAPQYATTTRTSWATDVNTALGSTAYVMILTGAQPANVATADTGTELVALPMSATAGTVSGGVFTANAITSTNAIAAGTAGHWLLCTTSVAANCMAASSTTRITQGSAGVSGADMNFASGATFASGETIILSSFVLTMGGA